MWNKVAEVDNAPAALDEPRSRIGVLHAFHLLRRELHQSRQHLLILLRLVEHHHKFGVGDHTAALGGLHEIVHILRDRHGIGIALAHLLPGEIKEYCAVWIGENHMELINENKGTNSILAVLIDPVQDRVGDDQQACRLEVLVQIVNIEDNDPFAEIHVGLAAENIQRADGVQLQQQGDLLGLRLRKLEQLLPKRGQRRLPALTRIVVDVAQCAVDDRLVLRPDGVVAELVDQRHNKLGLEDAVFPLVADVGHFHGVQPVLAACGNADHRADVAHGLHHAGILALRVGDDDMILGVEYRKHDRKLCKYGFAGTRHAETEGGLIQKLSSVDQDRVFGILVDAVVHTARIDDVLHPEGQEGGKAGGVEGAEDVDLPLSHGQDGVEPVHLLIAHRCDLQAAVLSGGEQDFRILVQLFLCIRPEHQGHEGVEHRLVLRYDGVQELPGAGALLLHLVGDIGGVVHAAVLPPLPVGEIRFHAQDGPLGEASGLPLGDCQKVNGVHHVHLLGYQLGNEPFIDAVADLLDVEHTGIAPVDDHMILFPFHAPRQHLAGQNPVAGEFDLLVFLAFAIEIPQDTETLFGVQRRIFGAQLQQMRVDHVEDALEVLAGLRNVVRKDGNGEIRLLDPALILIEALHDDAVELPAVFVLLFPLHGHADGPFQRLAAVAAVVDGEFHHDAGLDAVEQSAVVLNDLRPFVNTGSLVVDVLQADGLGVLVPKLEDAVLPDVLHRDDVPQRAGAAITPPVPLDHGFNAPQQHRFPPPVSEHAAPGSRPGTRPPETVQQSCRGI